jgi:hypothetical protein
LLNHDKMKKLLILCGLALLFFASFAYATTTLTNGLRAYYSFTSDCTTDATGQGETLTNSGVANVAGGIVGNGCDFESTESDYLVRDAIATATNMFQDNFTVCVWMKKESDVNAAIINSDSDTDHSTYRLADTMDTSNKVTSFVNAGSGNKASSASNTNGNTSLIHICTTVDTNGKVTSLYLDGHLEGGATVNSVDLGTQERFGIGCLYRSSGCLAGYYYDGILDEIGLWNRTLMETEIIELRDYNIAGITHPFSSGGGGTTPTVSINIGDYSNNTQVGYLKESDGILDFSINTTVTNCTDIFNGSVLVNNTFYQSIDSKNLSLNHQFNFSFINLNAIWNITFNISNSECNTIRTLANITVDGINPAINVTNLINNSIYYKNVTLDYFNYSVVFADNNLFAYNITLENATGSLIYNNFTTSLAVTSYNLSKRLNLTNNKTGNYSLRFDAWDSHTAVELSEAPILKDSEGAEVVKQSFEGSTRAIIGEEVKPIEIRPAVELDYKEVKFYCDNTASIDYNLETDRIRPIAYFNDASETQTCYYESSNFVKVENSEYPNHYVDLDKGIWIDDYTGTAELINSGLIKITYTSPGEPLTEIVTDSIGDLNKASKTYNFTIEYPFYFYANDNNTGTPLSIFTVALNNGTSIQEFSTTTGILPVPYNSGAYNVTFSSNTYINRTFLSITLAPNQYLIGSLNASGSFTVYVKDELTLALILQYVRLEFIPTTTNTSKNYSTTSGVKYINDLNPDDYIIRYSSANYSDAFYYFTLTNSTSTIFNIYMLPQPSTSNITATVIDEVANELEGAYIHVQRYDLNTNNYVTVEIVKTNFEGKAVIHVTKNTEFYKFLIYYGGELKKTTTPTYIYENDITFQIQLSEPVAETFYTSQGVDYSLTYNPATCNFNFVFSDNSNTITSGTLKVYNVTAQGSALWNSSTVAATSGTLLACGQNISNTLYRADAYVTISGEQYFLTSLYYEYPAEKAPETGGNMFLVALVCLVFGFLGLFRISLAVVTMPLPLLGASILGFISLPFYVCLPIEILAIIIAAVIEMKAG